MSRSFNGSSDYIESSAAVTGYSATISCWFFPDSVDAALALVSIGDSSATSRFTLQTATSTPAVAALAQGPTGGSAAAFSTAAPSASIWQHAAGTFGSPTSRSAFINGGNKGTNTTSTTAVSGFNATTIGARYVAGARGLYMDGLLAEVGVWNIALSDVEIASLGRGFSPRLVRPQSLVFYAPLIRNVQDLRGGATLTATGTTIAAHPRLFA